LGIIGNYWELLGIIGNYWELLGIIGNYWELLGIIGNYDYSLNLSSFRKKESKIKMECAY
jgi:hypothetical protein